MKTPTYGSKRQLKMWVKILNSILVNMKMSIFSVFPSLWYSKLVNDGMFCFSSSVTLLQIIDRKSNTEDDQRKASFFRQHSDKVIIFFSTLYWIFFSNIAISISVKFCNKINVKSDYNQIIIYQSVLPPPAVWKGYNIKCLERVHGTF